MLPDGYWPLAAVVLAALAALGIRAVSARGAWAGGLVGGCIVLGTGWTGFAMLFAFLGVGTLSSDPKRRRRGAVQALCNGMVAAAAATAAGLGARWGWPAMAGALATGLSDTVAGELGHRFGGEPRALLFGPRVAPGTDGGMSWTGTLTGVAAAFVVPLVGALVGGGFDARAVALLALAGFAGNLVDSVLGWTLQARLGPWGNDATNLIATLGGAVFAVALVL
ncbi:MAG: DUF92 domain-containing protein [Planctomycetota bacterium]|jgi:uncharacterized protein (TIGR00297 family)